ncbi:hypothetical protein HDF13_000805 [Edaphobacter lichenicola]|uniref:Uncharacterized protein n=1 Tax=Tunturiibacter gelidiferens TaxID=3069689 RepID=A0ACC5NV75_9BACT|nr:hypothetical protein [Edaphobacter lichenicola]
MEDLFDGVCRGRGLAGGIAGQIEACDLEAVEEESGAA